MLATKLEIPFEVLQRNVIVSWSERRRAEVHGIGIVAYTPIRRKVCSLSDICFVFYATFFACVDCYCHLQKRHMSKSSVSLV